MSAQGGDALRRAAERIVDLEAELEASGDTTLESDALARQRAILHDWVDSVVGVVSTPGVGRVVLLHQGGGESRIASPDLPHRLTAPVTFSSTSED